MDQKHKTSLCRSIHKLIVQAQKQGALNPISLTEAIADRVEFVFDIVNEESGIASVPSAEEVAPWDIAANEPARPPEPEVDPEEIFRMRSRFTRPPAARGAVEPARPKAAPIIALPGDAEFQEADPSNVRHKPLSISAVDVRRNTGMDPNRKQVSRKQWEDGALMETINANTPDELAFEPVGTNGVTLAAVKNIHFLPGIGASLTYCHKAVDQTKDNFLTAKWSFSIYDAELPIDKALYGPTAPGEPTCIMDQLKHQYRPRNKEMAPVMAGPPPVLSFDVDDKSGMNQAAKIDGYQQGMVVKDPLKTLRTSISQSNTNLTPAGSPLRNRDE